MKKIVYMVAVGVLALVLCTGCGSERKEEQQSLRLEGITLMENGKYEEALEKFQEALDLSLGKVNDIEMDICFYKAEAQYMLEDAEGALETYTAIVDYNENAKAYFLRGNLYYSLGEEEKALKDYAAAIEQESKDYDLYIGVYEALTANGKEKEAQDYLNQALEIKGDSAYDKMQKGRINFLLGENKKALSLLEEAAKGKEKKSFYYLAEIYSIMGDEASSQSNMKSYLESGETDSYTLFQIANDELGKANFDMAISCLKSALELEKVPNKQIIMKTLVIAYEQKLDFASALEVMQKYVEAYPDDEEAKRELTFLETRIPGNVTEDSEKTEDTEKTEETEDTEKESEKN
ncbi:MAG: tetratricopeptide repeat protein [Agathobacter sp.]|nr:tetratricopeptide repeat protein [Agathobacter sp.]